VLGSLAWFQFDQPRTRSSAASRRFDRGPSRHVLILGDSRTYYTDTPDMIRAMAASARDPEKLEITLDAPVGASFAILRNDERTQGLLRRHWDDVVLQGESRG